MKANYGRVVMCLVAAALLVAMGPEANGQGKGRKSQCTFTSEPAQMQSVDQDYTILPLFTIGESVGDYTPPGIPDGMGIFKWTARTNRLLVNHELSSGGFPYVLANGTTLEAARVSYFDIDRKNLGVCDAGVAYDTIIDGFGNEISDGNPLCDQNGNPLGGLRRLCSANGFRKGEFGFRDDVFFTGEETGSGGYEYVVDVKRGVLYQLPWLGKAAWESVTVLDTGDPLDTAILVGDDRAPAPLILYMGRKDPRGNDFLKRNGLDGGDIYVWVSNSGDPNPTTWNGTGSFRNGTFVQIDITGEPNTEDYDKYGYAKQAKQDELAAEVGAFLFSRPEDIDTSPFDGSVAVLASTGRQGLFGNADLWGTTYIIDVDFEGPITAELEILYDGDDTGGGQFAHPDFGLRSPDNLCWAKDGFIYLQEDRAISSSIYGATSGEESSIWRLSMNGVATRVVQMDRSGIPAGQTDVDPDDLGDWESSGIIDVSSFFGYGPGELLLANTQAHSLRDEARTPEWRASFVEGGQLFFIFVAPSGE